MNGHAADVVVAHVVLVADIDDDEVVDHVPRGDAVVSHACLRKCQMQGWLPLPLKPLLSPPVANRHLYQENSLPSLFLINYCSFRPF